MQPSTAPVAVGHAILRRGARLPPRDAVVLALIGGLAFALRLQMTLRGGGLLAVGPYDDGVHYAAGASLLHGALPYRDFLFLHPPAMVLAAAPFAALGSVLGDPVGLQVFRVAFQLVGALNAVLVAAILRRFGMPAAVCGGFFAAVFFPAVYDERIALLEPLGTLCVLVALLLIERGDRRSFLLAGAALGTACGFKIWYVVPALVVLAFARGGRVRVLLGVVAAGLLIQLPFFLAAPVTMFQQVVLAQTGRERATGGGDLFGRVQVLLGVRGIGSDTAVPGVDPAVLTVLLLVPLAVGVAIALATPGARVVVALLAGEVAVVLASPSFFTHYAALPAPAVALLLGVAAARVLALLRGRVLRAIAVATVLLAVAGLNVRHVLEPVDVRPPDQQLRAAAARIPGCIASDDPTILAVMDVLSRDLRAGCPLRPDVSGYSFGPLRLVQDGRSVSRQANTAYQRSVVDYLLAGDAFIAIRRNTGLSTASAALLDRRPLLFGVDGYALRAGTGGPVASGR